MPNRADSLWPSGSPATCCRRTMTTTLMTGRRAATGRCALTGRRLNKTARRRCALRPDPRIKPPILSSKGHDQVNEQELSAIKSLAAGRATACRVEGGPSQLPDHLVKIPGQHWAFWRTVALRGAGFPASQPALLATPKSAALAD